MSRNRTFGAINGPSGIVARLVTASFNLTPEYDIADVDSSVGAITIGLPQPTDQYPPSNGEIYTINDVGGAAATHNITIESAGIEIQGSGLAPTTSTSISANGGSLTVEYCQPKNIYTVMSQPGASSGSSSPSLWYGDGSDGAFTMDGTTSPPSWAELNGSTYLLGRDVYLTSLTINAGVTFATNGFRVYATVSITNHGIIDNSGAAAVGSTGGAGAAGGSLAAGAAGGTGSSATTGATGGNGASASINGIGGSGGAASGGSHGGSGGTTTDIIDGLGVDLRALPFGGSGFIVGSQLGTATAFLLGGGSGGGAGAGNGEGGDGGGGGGSGGAIMINAASITNSGVISAIGGAGAAGVGSPAGGGGGGGGGVVVLLSQRVVTLGTIEVGGGAGGAAGGAGHAGNAGGAGATYSLTTS